MLIKKLFLFKFIFLPKGTSKNYSKTGKNMQ